MLFYHEKEGIRYTAAVQLPTKAEIVAMLAKSQDYIQVGFGISFVHPKDNFNKKLGRSVAGQRVTNYVFHLREIRVEDGRTSFLVSTPARHNIYGGVDICVRFSTVPKSMNVHLESVSLEAGSTL